MFKHMFSIVGLLLLIVGLVGGVLPAAAQDDVVIPEGTPIALGETLSGHLSPEIPIVAYTFEGKEDDAITVYVEDEDGVARYILIADDEGDIIFQVSFDDLYLYEAHVPLYFLPDDGMYSVAVTSSDYVIFQESDKEADFSVTLDTPQYAMISYGEAHQDTLTPENLFDMYVFDVEEGDIPFATLTADNLPDLQIDSLTDPEFNEMRGNSLRDSSTSYITPRFMMDDDHLVILVSRSLLFEDVPYELTLDKYAPIEITADAPVEIELTVETLTNYLVFEGEEDQEIEIRVDAPEAINPTVVLFDPDADVIAVVRDGDAIKNLELSEDGAYVIAVMPGETLVGAENLGIVKVTLLVED